MCGRSRGSEWEKHHVGFLQSRGVSLEGSREPMEVSAQVQVAEEEGPHGCGVRENKERTDGRGGGPGNWA